MSSEVTEENKIDFTVYFIVSPLLVFLTQPYRRPFNSRYTDRMSRTCFLFPSISL